ncbi:MAG: PH domain-containing protein [Planctomycetota bacterium]
MGPAADPSPPVRHPATTPGDAAAPDEMAVRAAALLPDQLLQPGEVIVLLLKPHPLYILLAPLKTLVILLLVTTLGVLIAGNAGAYTVRQNIVILGGLIVLSRLFWQFFEWLSRVYVLTDQRVVAMAGVLRVRVFEAPLNRIAHSELLFSVRERVFALGTLGFYTAGSGVAEAFWVMVAHPLDVHAKVVQTLKRYRR